MTYTGLNKMLIVIGAMLSFMSLIYAAAHYLEMRSIESLINWQDYGDDVVVEKLRQISLDNPAEVEIYLLEIRNRGEQLLLLRKGMSKTVSRAKLFAGVEFVLWFISVIVFSILLILMKWRSESE